MIRRASLLTAAMIAASSAQAQQSVQEAFRGKTLTVVIPTTPGGDRSANATAFMNFFGRHVPGNPNVVPAFMPGAGGLLAMNYLASVASRDGLTIATPLTTLIVSQVTGDKAVKYDVSKMAWIGRTSESTQVLYVWHTVDAYSIDDLKKRVLTVGSSGVNSPSTIIPQIMNYAAGTKMKVIQGYKGSVDFNLATMRGETDASLTTWGNMKNNHANSLQEKKARILFQVVMSRHNDLKDVPLAVEAATNDDDRALIEFMSSSADLGQAFVAPPGVPPHILAALRQAFDDTMKDPEYISFSARAGNEFNPMSGVELAKLAAKTLATPAKVIARYEEAVAIR